MTIISRIDGTTSPRRVYLHLDTVGTTLNPIDIYKEMRNLRSSDETLRKFDLFMMASGNVPKGGGKFTERYITLLNTRIVPFDRSHVLTINGTLITDDGLEGILAFDKTVLSSTTSVDIAYVPPQVEIVTVNVGSAVTAQDKIDIAKAVRSELYVELSQIMSIQSGLTTKQATMLLEMYVLLGLDPEKPLIVTHTSRSSGNINQIINSSSDSTTIVRV